MYVMGTAGHVDHGKSSLVIALSGIDPDRLPEEKTRGLTIDLGFAWLTTGSGRTVGIVDVPGHERFVRNMIAGVGAIDFVLFVVAADDGWMPQSSEHLAILRYLDVRRGIVVVTKKNLVDPDWLTLVLDDVHERLQGTFLADAPCLAVDSISGDGIDELTKAIDRLVETLPPRPDIGRPRLYIDRAFAVAGRGAVVTGTLIDGALVTGRTVMVAPDQVRARVRELQVHGHAVTQTPPGQRVAVNLAGIELSQLHRGQCLVNEDDTETVDRLWADVHLLPEITYPLKSERHLLVMVGTAEPEGIAYPIDPSGIEPGGNGFCELRLFEPLKVRLRDRFVLRWPTPGMTIGGGIILDVGGARRWRREPGFTEHLRKRLRGTIDVYRETELHRCGFAERRGFLKHGPFSAERINADLIDAARQDKVVLTDAWILDPEWLAEAKKRMIAVLNELHRQHPHLAGLNVAEWQERSAVPREAMSDLVGLLEREGLFERSGDACHLPQHTPHLPQEWESENSELWQRLENGGMQPPTRDELETVSAHARQIVGFWLATGRVVALGDGVILPAVLFDRIRCQVTGRLQNGNTISAAQLRDLLGTTRRYAVPILEALDREGTTQRVGDVRVLATTEATGS